MRLTSLVPFGALAAQALALPQKTPGCASFGADVALGAYNATLLNSTYYSIGSLNNSDVLNTVSFCELYASISYGTGNDTLIFALWLPDVLDYDKRFMAVGNGGMAGTIDYANMMTQLNSGMGFAVAGGNAGHLASANNGGGGAPGVYLPYLHDQDQVQAWIHDAVSLFTPAAKALTAAYYGRGARYAYYDGCSTGGAQGFALAQLHPELFDGIYAGSPGNWYSHLALSFLWNAQHTNMSATNLTQAVLNFTGNAVLAACDTIDGVKDGLIEDPLRCHFNIESLACNGSYASTAPGTAITCFTSSQIAAAQAIYAGPTRSDNGTQLYPGIPILQNLVYDDLAYDSNTFNWASNVADVDSRAGSLIDEIDPDLSAFRNRSGKMIVTQGWSDPLNAATWPIEHLEQIEDFFNSDVSDFFNLFMVPGGGHCGAAPSYPGVPATYHTVAALVDWVERGQKPEDLLSTNPPDGSNTTRKLCAWPSTARFVGADVDDWNSYVCE
ncbi:hypothetical protein B0A55_09610 [Friedmanniomyces simplex]|uniref:Carboxylic ester hydrolase n=1 Tax=Friedmanniomyces simplex TaxID=329884 RepID=A0A4U0WK89_9PEZI|nr:hypothetical protein B0A55_09610 [Friedmanniomyces simplex]